MEINVQDIPGGRLVTVAGRLDASTGIRFETETGRAIETSTGALVIDCRGLEFLSSAGIRCLLAMLRKLQPSSRRLILAAPPAVVRETIVLAGLDRHLAVCDTLGKAREAAQ